MAEQEIYAKIPPQFTTNTILNPDEYITKFLTSIIPSNDIKFSPKSLLVFPKTKPPAVQKHRSKKAALSRKKRQSLGLIKCPKTGWDFRKFSKIRQMWQEYIRSYLGIDETPVPDVQHKEWSNFCQLLTKAEFHGAPMEVVRSKCPNLIGVAGTCLVETKNTFKILSKDNKLRTIPKKDSVFKISLDMMELEIYGKYLVTKPADRSTKKVKTLMVPDL